MENIVVERALNQSMTEGDLHALRKQVEWCLQQNRVRPLYTYLGRDGRRMVCVFQSPDAEAVRRVNQTTKLPARSTWVSSVHRPPPAVPPDAGDLVLVERSFPAPVVFEEIQALENGGAWCLQQHRVYFARTYFSTNRRRMLCVYRAPDVESVRLAQKTIGMPFDDVWPAHLVLHTEAPA